MDIMKNVQSAIRPQDGLSIGYIKILKVFLTILAGWPYQVGGGRSHPLYTYYGISIVPLTVTAVAMELWYLVDNFSVLSFFVVGHMYLTVFFGSLLISRLFLPLQERYGEIVEEFLLKFHLLHFKHKSSYHLKMYEKLEWLSHRVVIITMGLAMLCATALNLMPVFNNITSGAYTDENKTVELAIYFSYPGFDPLDHYTLATFFSIYVVFGNATLVGGTDVLMSLFIIQIIGHIEVLNNSLLAFPKPKQYTVRKGRTKVLETPMFTVEENLIIKERIKQCIEHHLLIVNFTDRVSGYFGPVLAIYLLFHQVSGCMLLLELSVGDSDALTKYGPLTIIIFGQLIMFSTIFEIVNTKSELLANTAYAVPWENMSVSNQRSLCLLLRRLQQPIVVKALGVATINVQTMGTILKTSLSYFTFLRNLRD